MATQNPPPLMGDGRVVDFQASGTVPRPASIHREGTCPHVTSRVRRAKSAPFYPLPVPGPRRRAEAPPRQGAGPPVLTYPPIPLHALSRTAISKLQRVQNAALRFVVNHRWGDFVTMDSPTRVLDLPAINVRLHHMASQCGSDAGGRLGAVSGPAGTQRRGPDRSQRVVSPGALRALRDDPDPAPRYS
ncbi:hypothetical protein GWK47_012225 [Chionoecetes opilio]|uniref:Uncharacterized protein n=1 Tax=Chionoecetes opilio TaxID=41210 RepID=A0A8J4XUZ5_CHIOP|nr:hypothetical protein GWK47_012225 [Chionoecetes opilio]